MFAVRFFAVAFLLAAAPLAAAIEPSSPSTTLTVSLSLASPPRQSTALKLLTADSFTGASGGLANAPRVDTSLWQPQNQELSGLASVYPSAGSADGAVNLNLLTPQSAGFQATGTPLSLATSTQLLLAPRASADPTPTWFTPQSSSVLFTKPTVQRGFAR